MNINDWQTIQTRNYVKEIKDSITKVKSTDWAVFFDVLLLLIAFLLDKIFDDSKLSKGIWIGLLIIVGFGSIVFFYTERKRIKQKERTEKYILPPKEIVALFDDEVCYKIMSAISFLDHLKSTITIKDKEAAVLTEFYCTETLYYANKSVSLLVLISSNLSNAVSLDSDAGPEKISINRLENICRLINTIYDDTLWTITNAQVLLMNYNITMAAQVETSQMYRQAFTDFETQVNTIKKALENNN